MSKYSKLLGLVREILPTGEKVLIKEGDDLLRQLHRLDERDIENIVSEMDASRRAEAMRRNILKKVDPTHDTIFGDNRFDTYERFGPRPRDSILDAYNKPKVRELSGIYFPREYDPYLNLDEFEQLQKQSRDSLDDRARLFRDKMKMQDDLKELNPDVNMRDIDVYGDVENNTKIAKERFNKIRDAMMKASKK